MAGRPLSCIEFFPHNPQRSLAKILKVCREDENVKSNMLEFASSLTKSLVVSEERSTQSENVQTSIVQSISELIENCTSYEKSFLLSNIWSKIDNDDQIKMLFLHYSELEFEQQVNLFAFLGNSLNQTFFEESKRMTAQAKDLDIGTLKKSTKTEFYRNGDRRLTTFMDTLTERQHYQNESVNYKCNAYENLLKARNLKFVSNIGVKEHMVSYLASGKSRHSTQVFSKQGAKGTRPVLEIVLKNSEDLLKFKAPDHSTLFFSFDNIQTLLKSHRVGGDQQKKVLAVVVCSILCTSWGERSCIQYKTQHCPAFWYSSYKFEKRKSVLTELLNTTTLKKCLEVEKDEEKVFNDFFEMDLIDALDFVKNDIFENNEDSIDLESRKTIAKKRKLCEKNHINDNVTSNRKICDRSFCKAKLKIDSSSDTLIDMRHKRSEDSKNPEDIRAKTYMNVENVIIDDIPEEHAVGAAAINPNKKERLSKVLDIILENAGIKNKYSVKLVFSGDNVTKILNSDDTYRKFVVVTADGLPYKALIELIKDVHSCAICGKRFEYLAEVTNHVKTTQHSEYFQTYGNILPNIGQFHYALTMLRSLVKISWDLDYEGLVKAIHFDTPKGLFMQQKVTEFRKSLDTYRAVRKAKLRELVTPFVKYAREQNTPIDIKSYFDWKKKFVKCETYKSVFEIEKVYGTAFLLYHAALRANNSKIATIAKKHFSPLFHINRHPNYSIMDIHIDYLDHTMALNAPELKNYLDQRKSTNFSRQNYAGEPHDERHEEFNKRGLNMQNVKSAEDFKQSFQLVDHYIKMKESCFEDYDIKIHGGNIISNIDLEGNISKMRIEMRKQSYLSRPQLEKSPMSLEKKKLNPKIADIANIALKQRQEDVINVIRHNDFNHGYNTTAFFKVLKHENESKLKTNYETQLEILIASEENAEIRENLTNYCLNSRNHPDFDEEKMVDDILARNFGFL